MTITPVGFTITPVTGRKNEKRLSPELRVRKAMMAIPVFVGPEPLVTLCIIRASVEPTGIYDTDHPCRSTDRACIATCGNKIVAKVSGNSLLVS